MNKTESKIIQFFRRNAVYVILALCIVAIGASMLIYFLTIDTSTVTDNPTVDNTKPDGDETENPDDAPTVSTVSFLMPIENVTEIGKYSEMPVFSETIGRYSAHLAIDFFASEGTDVLAVYDGTVESVNNTLLEGTTIVIDHGDGLKTIYNSLADGDAVNVGQVVKKGDVIGQVSNTNRQESHNGAHLHFQVMENGEIINPDKYLELDEK